MALATANERAEPSVRFVLLKAFAPDGFDFYTDYRSDKADQLEANPRAALALWWPELGRQVRVSGPASSSSAPSSSSRLRSCSPSC